mgnify:CR=1 FL=1
MKYTVLRIEEDIDFGCEERSEDEPIMAIVTLLDENGEESKIRQEDQRLYDLDINEGDHVVMNEKNKLQKVWENRSVNS